MPSQPSQPLDAAVTEAVETTPATSPKPVVAPQAAATIPRIQPTDLVYLGAFRLPAVTGDSNWEYSAYAMTYVPSGDPGGPADGFPGSIFAIGHDHHQLVSEINIPKPVISESKQINDLPVAETLQPFADIRGGLVGELEIPRAGLEFLPGAAPGEAGRLHFCWGQHFQFEPDPSHGWCELNLSSPQPRGLWRLNGYTNYVTNDYLFEIPQAWSTRYLPGYRLATGRFRDGQWGGLGPAILAYQPPDTPPANKAVLTDVKPLLMYGRQLPDTPELEVNDAWKMNGYSESDEWSGGAWLTLGDRQAVVLVGTKAIGKTWYGFSNGVVYPISGDPNDPIPEVPPFPHDARGWWSQGIEARLIFFDAGELAAVAQGKQESWTPQPYASLRIDRYLFEPGYDHPRQKRYSVGACCLDRERGVLYVAERCVQQDEERSVIHAFRIGAEHK
ncbi:MAG: hypothetical protein KDB14_19680 [Planctomycetales bacterium]|nr:hypothetical protein [Planctomycetales bacterium]